MAEPPDDPAIVADEPRGPLWMVWRWPLHWQILLGLLIGAIMGLALGWWAVTQIPAETAGSARGGVGGQIATDTWTWAIFDLLGDLFLNALKLIIVPIVVSSITLAVAQIGGQGDFGRLGSKTLIYYMCTSLIAILIGLTLVDLVRPGVADGRGILVGEDISAFQTEQATVGGRVSERDERDVLQVFRDMIPPNIVEAAAAGQLLGLIVVSMLVGYFLSKLGGEPGRVILNLVQGVYDLTLAVTGLVLRLAPIGVLFLIASTFGEQFAKLYPDARLWQFVQGLGTFALVAAIGLLIHFLVTMPLILMFIARVNPLRHYKAMAPALLTAFSTASSSATLPVTMECVEKRAGVSNRTTSFILPLGATVNMDGTALYECVAAIFIAQAFGVELSFATQFYIVLVALLTSIGVAGVPSASLVAIAIILQGVQNQLPEGQQVNLMAGMALLFVFDRPLDMMRTALNIFSDSVGAVTIARIEGEAGVLGAGKG